MTPETLSEKIGLPEKSRAAALELNIPEEKERELHDMFKRDQKEFEDAVRQMPDPELCVLSLYLRWGAEAYDLYQSAGVPDDIYYDTFRDITLWSKRYAERTGKIGLIEWAWFSIHMRMKIFRLGRLQFERINLKGDAYIGQRLIPAGTPALSIHIPAGESLAPEKVRESIELSKIFFSKYLGEKYSVYYCCSWLLARELCELLPENSGIAEFRRLFFVYDEDYSYSQAEDYVFTQKLDDPTKYTEYTSLQRGLKRFLLNGGRIGMGIGVFEI